MPLLVHYISKLTSLRTALYIMYPGMILLGSVLFTCALICFNWDIKRRQDNELSRVLSSFIENETQPILGVNATLGASYESTYGLATSCDWYKSHESTDELGISRDWSIA